MTSAVLKTIEHARPAFGRIAIARPSHATLHKIETVLAMALAFQMVALTIRYAL